MRDIKKKQSTCPALKESFETTNWDQV